MMPDTIVLAETDAIYHNDQTDGPDFRHCDFCHRPAWDVPTDSPWYEVLGEGLVACGDCVPTIKLEEASS